jgi:putative PIN family toxin of toxin-antitoxin system
LRPGLHGVSAGRRVTQGAAFAILLLAETGRLSLLISDEILTEVREVLFRPSVQERFPLLTAEFVDAFLSRLGKMGTRIDAVTRAFQFARDPDDEAYLNLAISGAAHYFVTRDRALPDLAGTSADAIALRLLHPGLRILDPASFLRELASEEPTPTSQRS